MSKLLTLAALLIPATGDSVRPGAHPAAPPSRFAPLSSIELWTDPDDVLQPNDQVRVYFRSEFDAYMTVLRVDTDGRIQVLFPGTPWRNNWVRAQREYEVKPGPERYTFLVDDYPGQGFILAVASAGPFRYDALVAGEEWDFRALGEGGWIKGDPYEALMQIIDDIVPDSSARYDYDVLPYENKRSKQTLLERATTEGWRIVLDHDPDRPVVCSRPAERKGRFALEAVDAHRRT